jgi:beta-aspartyl-peptidase (threonine type)
MRIALAIHGGAGTIRRSEMTEDLENAYRQGLSGALEAGWQILRESGSALKAVEAAVCALEDCPLFNAGKGSVFTHEEKNEMDAAIMCGKTLKAGSVSLVTNVKNPIILARLVMERTEHVMLAGQGAMEFAREQKVEFVPDDYFFTEFRYRQLLEARQANRIQLDHHIPTKNKIGTVGAVACDINGNVATATSTGGMTNKLYGRIGDTPIIGAGTYADNSTCAVSCTGHGEFFMRFVTAYDVAAQMKYQGLSVIEAARNSVKYLRQIGGEGGLIAVDYKGNITLPFNSEGMYRGWIAPDGEPVVKIYRE